MGDKVLIRVENVSKKFCRTLKRSLWYAVKDIAGELFCRNCSESRLRPGEFWAVNDASFELKRGECLGLIGPNGAGKSTLLKMLGGIIVPDKGTIKIHGRVASLIELGAGFHPMLTARENIYINGSILGLTRKEIDAKFKLIVDFAELGEFINTPVNFFSTGMYARLGFAVAAHSDSDILLVDEVLSVGDVDFQKKCMNLIEDIKEKGTIIVLVSHNPVLIERNTTKTLLLNQGEPIFMGSTTDALSLYSNLYQNKDEEVKLFVDQNHILHIELPFDQKLVNKIFVGFAFKNGNRMCALVKSISQSDIYDDNIKLNFNLSVLENGRYFFTYRIRDKVKHNKVLKLAQNAYFEITNNYSSPYIGTYESCGLVVEGENNG